MALMQRLTAEMGEECDDLVAGVPGLITDLARAGSRGGTVY